MDFTEFHCPVCNKNFIENDDVVVCPECGTPHHRECYKNSGKCFNESFHGTDSSLADNYKNPETKKEKEFTQKSVENNKGQNTDNPFNINGKVFPGFMNSGSVQDYLIEGKHSSLFEAAVGKSQNYYIPRFTVMSSLKKGLSFNFIAFFAPFAWSLYRKMYKFAALIFAAYALLFGLMFFNIYTNSHVIDAVNECVEEMQNNPELYSDNQMLNYETSDATLTDAQKNLIEAIDNISVPFYITILSYLIPYAPKILLGLFGNKIYMKKLCKNIDDAEKKGLDGDKLKLYLHKKYGTLPLVLVVIVGIVELLFI